MPKIKLPSIRIEWRRASAAVTLCVLTLGFGLSPLVRSDAYQSQINSLNAANAQTQSTLIGLQGQAASYQSSVNQLQSEISSIQVAVSANEAKQASLQAQITQDEQQITQNKQFLADDVKTMYVDGQESTIEELATSSNLSDYVDKEEDRTVIQDKLNDLLASIQSLQSQAQDQKSQVDTLLATEKAQQSQLDSDEAQQANLLSLNQSQQNQYNQEISGNNAKIAALKQAQAAANASVAKTAHITAPSSGLHPNWACADPGRDGDPGDTGGYPQSWCTAGQDSFNDANGFPVRECTSYAYWYFTSVEGQTGFRVSGNAGWWWETSNYAVSQFPDVEVGAIGIEPSSSLNAPVPSLHGGYYGHVMIVKALPGQTYQGQYVPQGDVLVASMNEDEEGHFMYNLWPDNYLLYVNPH